MKLKGFIYSINVDLVLSFLYFPKLLLVVRKYFGNFGVLLMEEVISYGRVKVKELRNYVKNRISRLLDLRVSQMTTESAAVGSYVNQSPVIDDMSAEDLNDEDYLESRILSCFEGLVQRRLLVTVQSLEFILKSNNNTYGMPRANDMDNKRPGIFSDFDTPLQASGTSKFSFPSRGGPSGGNSTLSSQATGDPTTRVVKRKRGDRGGDLAGPDTPLQALPVELRMLMSSTMESEGDQVP